MFWQICQLFIFLEKKRIVFPLNISVFDFLKIFVVVLSICLLAV